MKVCTLSVSRSLRGNKRTSRARRNHSNNHDHIAPHLASVNFRQLSLKTIVPFCACFSSSGIPSRGRKMPSFSFEKCPLFPCPGNCLFPLHSLTCPHKDQCLTSVLSDLSAGRLGVGSPMSNFVDLGVWRPTFAVLVSPSQGRTLVVAGQGVGR